MSWLRRAAWIMALVWASAGAIQAQNPMTAATISVGTTLPPAAGTTTRLVGLATSGGTDTLFVDADGNVRRRVLALADLPAGVGLTGSTNTWSSLQTFSSGIAVNDGAVGTPGLRFTSDPDTGLYRIGTDSLGISTGGGLRLTVNTTGTTAAGTLTSSGVFTASSTSTFTGLATFTGNVRATASPFTIRNSTNAANLASFADAGVTLTGTAVVTGGTTLQSTLGVTGATTLSSTLGVTGLSTLTGGFASSANSSIAGNLTLTGTGNVTAAGDVAVNGGDITSTASVLNIDAGGTINLVDAATFAGNAGTSAYASQTTGWRITAAGGADFRYLFTDELHAKSFIADLEQALAGGQIISKSVAMVATAFTCPVAGGTATLRVRDLPSAANIRVFAVNDWVVLRTFARTDGNSDGNLDLTIGDCVGQVSAYADGAGADDGTQTWTFTRGSGGNAGSLASGTVIAVDSLALDFGVSGNGYAEVSATDGAEGVNAPYYQVATWATSPVAANRSVRARFGNLRGITGSAGEFGLLAGTYAATNGQYIRASSSAVELHGVDFTLWDGSTSVFAVRRNAGAPYLSLGSTAPTAYGSGTGVWMGKDAGAYKFRVGDPAGNRLTWDGSTLSIVGNGSGITAINGGNITAGTIDVSRVTAGLQDGGDGLSLARNGGAEVGPLGGTPTSWTLGSGSVVITESDKVAGSRSFYSGTTADNYVYQDVWFHTGTYTATFWVKTVGRTSGAALVNFDSLGGGAGYSLIARENPACGYTVDVIDTGVNANTQDWTLCHVRFKVTTQGALRVYVQFGYGTFTGQGWIDGLVIRRDAAIVAADIVAGTITANEIAAGAISADKVAVGFGTNNLIANGTFESGIQGWACVEGTQCGAISANVYGLEGAGTLLITTTAGNTAAAGYRAIPIEAGNTYFVRLRLYSSASTAGGLYVRMNESNVNAAVSGWLGNGGVSTTRTSFTDLCSNCSTTAGWQTLEYIYTAPGGVTAASLSVYNWTTFTTLSYFHVDAVQVIKRTGLLSALSADLGQISINATNGYIRSGSTTPGSGTGVWLGVDAGTPKFYVGNGTGTGQQSLFWNGTSLNVRGATIYANEVYSANFTNPSGSVLYGATSSGATTTLGSFYGNEIIVNSFQLRPTGSGSVALGTNANRWGTVHATTYAAGGLTGLTQNFYVLSFDAGGNAFGCQVNVNGGLVVSHNCRVVP
jgi:hypothetical protein